jgi:hypothetical protein
MSQTDIRRFSLPDIPTKNRVSSFFNSGFEARQTDLNVKTSEPMTVFVQCLDCKNRWRTQ